MTVVADSRPSAPASPATAHQGKTTPRIWTPPLATGPPGPCGCGCALTPGTTQGFAVAIFAAEVLRRPLDPWQRWLVIHALEVLPNGWPRFRQVVVLVARQNGKTELLVILSLFWMWVLQVGLVLGTSTKLEYSKESWVKASRLAMSVAELRTDLASRKENGKEEFWTPWGSRYKIAAANEEGGRSLTVHRLVEDELRQHHDYSAHEAAENAMNAVPDAQAWAITNEGDSRSVVLHDFYDAGLRFIETGEGDYRLGLFVWAAPAGCDLLDVEATAQANPNLGSRIFWENLQGKALRAQEAGGELEAKYRTEVLCQRVGQLDPLPITVAAWKRAATPGREVSRTRPMFGVSVAPMLTSAAIVPATWADADSAHLELIQPEPGVDWLIGKLVELKDRYPGASFVGMSTGAVASLLPDLIAAGIDLEQRPSTELGKAYGLMQKMLAEGRLTHSGAGGFESALLGAVKRDVGEGLWSLGWRKSSSDLTPIEAGAIGLWKLAGEPAYDPDVTGFY